MVGFVDVCRFTPTAGGTTDWTFSAAVTGYQSPALAGIVNTQTYHYRAESNDLSQWEMGTGTYNTATNVLTRATVLFNSSGTGTGSGQSGAGTKINFSTVPQVAIVALNEDFREFLIANRTYFVRSDGSDSNSGLVNSATGAFLTWAKAVTAISALDFNGFTVTMFNGNAATYTTGIVVNKPWVGPGTLVIDGNGGAINETTGKAIMISNIPTQTGVGNAPGQVTVQNFTLSTTTFNCLEMGAVGVCTIGPGMVFGATGQFHYEGINPGGVINITSGYTVSGGGLGHFAARGGGTVYNLAATCTLSANVTFTTAFAISQQGGYAVCNGFTTVLAGHTVTGPRFLVESNCTIDAQDPAGTLFPGTTAGVIHDGGVYTGVPYVGYDVGTGKGGTVTQLTNKGTGVTLNTYTGLITMNNASLAAGAVVSFTLVNSLIAATDMLLIQQENLGGTVGPYLLTASSNGAGNGVISVRNTSAGALAEAIVLRFAIFRSANS